MKNIFNKIIIFLVLSGCSISNTEQQIKMPITLIISVVKGGVEFIEKGSSGLFVVTDDGKNYAYHLCDDRDTYNKCLNENKSKLLTKCSIEFNNPCEIIAKDDQIVYPGGVYILNKKFEKGDRINYFTVPALRGAGKYMTTGAVDINSLPDIYADENLE